MNPPFTVFGVVPALRRFGYAVVVLGRRPEEDRLLDLGAFKTEACARKLRVREMDDVSRRARELQVWLTKLITEHSPPLICAKSLSIPRSASAAAKVARAWGVLDAMASFESISLLQSTPQEIKKAVCKVVTASKYDVRNALLSRFDANKWLDLPDDVAEHGFDALGAIVACENTAYMQILRSQVGGSRGR